GRVREAVGRADHEEVERVLRVQPLRIHADGGRLGSGHRAGRLVDGELDAALVPGDVAKRRVDQAQEMALDPLTSEVVRYSDDERVVAHLAPLRLAEPRPVRGLVECPLEPSCYLGPQTLGSQLDPV